MHPLIEKIKSFCIAIAYKCLPAGLYSAASGGASFLRLSCLLEEQTTYERRDILKSESGRMDGHHRKLTVVHLRQWLGVGCLADALARVRAPGVALLGSACSRAAHDGLAGRSEV